MSHLLHLPAELIALVARQLPPPNKARSRRSASARLSSSHSSPATSTSASSTSWATLSEPRATTPAGPTCAEPSRPSLPLRSGAGSCGASCAPSTLRGCVQSMRDSSRRSIRRRTTSRRQASSVFRLPRRAAPSQARALPYQLIPSAGEQHHRNDIWLSWLHYDAYLPVRPVWVVLRRHATLRCLSLRVGPRARLRPARPHTRPRASLRFHRISPRGGETLLASSHRRRARIHDRVVPPLALSPPAVPLASTLPTLTSCL